MTIVSTGTENRKVAAEMVRPKLSAHTLCFVGTSQI